MIIITLAHAGQDWDFLLTCHSRQIFITPKAVEIENTRDRKISTKNYLILVVSLTTYYTKSDVTQELTQRKALILSHYSSSLVEARYAQ